MAARLNKKILCFVDEYGTAGVAPFHLGAVFVLANEAGRLDKRFSDLLEPNANEIHAVNLSDGYLQGLLDRLAADSALERVVMLNQKFSVQEGNPPVLYAQAVFETVKVGLKLFRPILVVEITRLVPAEETAASAPLRTFDNLFPDSARRP